MEATSRQHAVLVFVLGPALTLLAAADSLVIDHFDSTPAWRVGRNISGEGECELSLARDSKVGAGAMLVTDRCPERHAQWLVKRCPRGVWDLSKWQKLHLWVRGDASRKTLYFKAVDETGKQMFWRMGRLHSRGWRPFTIDLTRHDSVFRHENPNLARIASVGLRLGPHSGYAIAFDEMRLGPAVAEPVKSWPRPDVGARVGYLKPRHVNEIEDSIVGVNLHPGVGRLTEHDIDLLAGAGVKWAARMPLNLTASYDRGIRRALLKHQFKLHGIFGVNRLLEGQELENRLASIRRTVAGLKHITRHWEIGNEPNIPKFWSDKPNATEFGLMVKAFAQAIRSEQPDAIVISGGLVSYPLDFAKEMLDTGMGECVSYIGIHTPRGQPEDGGRGRTHSEALAAFRSLIRSYNPKLDVWQSEVQATPNVNFADVRGGITDYQQARHVARRFFIEQWLAYPASFWQLFKAGHRLDHPGALLRVDGTPTMKFFAIQNAAAILDTTLEPAAVPVSAGVRADPLLLWQTQATVRIGAGKAFVSPDVPVPPGANFDLTARVTTQSRRVEARLQWLGPDGKEITSVSSGAAVGAGPGSVVVCRRYPHAFRPQGAVAVRVQIGDPASQPLVLHSARLLAHGQGAELRAHGFRRRRDRARFVAYWLTPRPPVETVRAVCTLALAGGAEGLRDPVIIDMISGSVRAVPQPEQRDGKTTFHGLPVADYATVLTDRSSVHTQLQSTLWQHFRDADDLAAQFIADRFGRGRPEFWRLVGQAAAEQPALARAYRRAHELFGERLDPVAGNIAVRDLPRCTARIEGPSWRTSIVNPKSKHVDRYFTDVQAPGLDPEQLRVLVDGQPWPKRKWSDAPESARSWFFTRTGGVCRAFIVVPDGQEASPRSAIGYDHDACAVRVFCFRDRKTARPCLAYWAEPFGSPDLPSAKVTLAGRAKLLPARATVEGLVLNAEDSADERVLRGLPLRRSPTLAMDGG